MSLRYSIVVFLLMLSNSWLSAQSYYFPPVAGNQWDTLSPTALDWCPEKIAALNALLDTSNTKGFIVLKDGKIVMERYFDAFTPDSLWYWASAGKSLSAFLVGLAQEQGYLNINDPTADYLGSGWTNMPDSLEQQITIRDQLAMTTGLDYNVSSLDCTDPACLQYKADPGTQWYYHNAPYTLTHDVVEAATGVSWNLYTAQQLALRTGIRGLWFRNGYNSTFASTPRVMARFGLLMLAGGVWAGDTIMHDRNYFAAMTSTSNSINESYGYLWWLNGKSTVVVPGFPAVLPGPIVPNAPADMYAGLGLNDQKVYVVPSEDMVVIRMGNAFGASALAPSSFDNLLWTQLSDMTCDPTAIALTAKTTSIVYPNPANTMVSIQTDQVIQRIRVFDMQGRLVWSARLHDTYATIPVADWSSGIYHVVVSTDQGVSRLPLVVY